MYLYRNSRVYCEFWFIHPREKYRGLILIIGNAVYKSFMHTFSVILQEYIHSRVLEKKKNKLPAASNNPFPSKN